MNLRSCHYISKVPDLSIATPNIKELNLCECKNLVEVHNSVGHLDKLERWDLRDCIELQILPSSLMMKSLKFFRLFGCKRIEKFPDIPQEMEGLKSLNLFGTSITELPSSFGNLTGLHQLFLGSDFCSGHLPSSIYKLQHLRELYLSGIVKFPKDVEIDRQALFNSYNGFSQYGFLSLNFLALSFSKNCSEIDFILNSCSPLSLKCLAIRSENFTLPESIIRFKRLHWLEIRDCKFLQEIPRLPESIREVDASNCFSLNSQSISKLLLQVSLSYSLLKWRRRGLVGNGDGDGEGLMNLVGIFLREKGRSSIYI